MLEARGISKNFLRTQKGTNVFTAVQETTLTLTPGEVTVLSGRSGSGKTTLLNMMSGLLTPTTGQVLLDGQDIYALEDKALSSLRNQHFGVMPQGQTAIPSLTILENVMLPYTLYEGRVKDMPAREQVQNYALQLLEQTGIANLRDAMPDELSGGELRRMAIARAMVLRPEVLFADEPTGDLDTENTEIVLRMLRQVAAGGKAVLLVTHDRDAVSIGDRVLQMHEGILEETATAHSEII